MHRPLSAVTGGFIKVRRLAPTPLIVWDLLAGGLITAVLALRVLELPHLLHNEADLLPYARQFIDASWLPSDWYLNQEISYRYLFNLLFGSLYGWLGLDLTLTIGRPLTTLFFSAALVALFRNLAVSRWLLIPVVLFFIDRQGLAAGGWMVGGLETKPFAYACSIGALAALLCRRYRMMFLLLGLAFSLHILVGGYMLLCLLACLLMTEHRNHWASIARSVWLFPVAGLFGIRAVLDYLIAGGALPADLQHQAAVSYVTLRVPHHTLPSAWGETRDWLLPLIGWSCWFFALRLMPDFRYRTIGQFVLCAIGLFAVGLLFASLGLTNLLKFHWFRLGDVMIPLLGLVTGAMLVSDLLLRERLRPAGTNQGPPGPSSNSKDDNSPARWRVGVGGRSRSLAKVAAVVCSGYFLFDGFAPYLVQRPTEIGPVTLLPRGLAPVNISSRPVHHWVRLNTPRNARFLVDPMDSEFYVAAERALFVSFKHAPQSEGKLLEWLERLKALNGGRMPEQGGFAGGHEISLAYHRMEPAAIQAIAEHWDIDFMIARNAELPFQTVYRRQGWSVYDLNPEE